MRFSAVLDCVDKIVPDARKCVVVSCCCLSLYFSQDEENGNTTGKGERIWLCNG